MKKLRYIVAVISIGPMFLLSTEAQKRSIDSLRNILLTQIEDSNRVNTLNNLSLQLLRTEDSISALNSAEQAMLLSKKISFKSGLAMAYFNIGKSKTDKTDALFFFNLSLNIYKELKDIRQLGIVYRVMGSTVLNHKDYNEALIYYNLSLNEMEKLESKKDIGSAHYYIAMAQNSLYRFGEALANYNTALSFAREEKDTRTILRCLLEIGNIYLYQENLTEALRYFDYRMSVSKEVGDSLAIAQSYTSIIQVYLRQKKYTEALLLDSIALSIYKKLNNRYGVATHYSNMSDISEANSHAAFARGDNVFYLNKLDEALSHRLMAAKLFEEEKDDGAVSDNYANAAKLAVKLHHLSEANIYAEKSLSLSRFVNDYDNLRNSYGAIVSIDSAKGDFKRAFESYKTFIGYRDSNSNKEITAQLLQYKFDSQQALSKAQQDKKDTEQKRVKTLQYFLITGLGIIALCVLAIAFVQWRNNKHKQKANLLLRREKDKVERTLTELSAAQSQLIQSEKMAALGELTAGIAHEIQNPLNFVNNFSEVNKELIAEMKEEINKGNYDEVIALAKDVEDNQEKINHHGKRADAILKGMLQHSRKSNGQKEPTNINALADEYLRLTYHGLRAKDKSFNATLKTDFDESIGKINIIPQDIGRVLLNLYNNAFYAVSEKKTVSPDNYEPIVSVSTKKVNDKVAISVKDNGSGIPQKVLGKIFQPFITTKPTGQGTGLGLSLAYDIVKAHGGTINLTSNEGEGAEFVITLPFKANQI